MHTGLGYGGYEGRFHFKCTELNFVFVDLTMSLTPRLETGLSTSPRVYTSKQCHELKLQPLKYLAVLLIVKTEFQKSSFERTQPCTQDTKTNINLIARYC